MSKKEELTPITLGELDENDILDSAVKQVIESALSSGKIPLDAVRVQLDMNVVCQDDEGDEEVYPFAIANIALTNNERETSVKGLYMAWINAIKDCISNNVDPSCDEDLPDEKIIYLDTYQQTKKSLNKALKFLRDNEGDSDSDVGSNIIRQCLREIKSLNCPWAFNELFSFPKKYVSKAFYLDANNHE